MTSEKLSKLRDTWHERVTAFYASGQSGASWCATHQIKEHQLWYWVRKFRSDSMVQSSSARFIPVQIEEQASTDSPSLLIRVGAAVIEIHPGYDAQMLRDVVKALTSPC